MAINDTAMHGRICMVTGANSGLGKVTALELARMGASVVMVCREQASGEAAMSEIKAASGSSDLELLVADLSSQAAIRQMVEEYTTTHDRLHVLVNNAGVWPSRRYLTKDGLERCFSVNVLAPFLLTNLLCDTLKASAPARVVNIASNLHRQGQIHWDDMQMVRRYDGGAAYNQSKLALVMLTYAFARRLDSQQVTVNAVHPGWVRTQLGRDSAALARMIMSRFAMSAEQGATTQVYLASSPDVAGISGKYFGHKQAEPSSAASYDEHAQERLWQICSELTGFSLT